MTHCHIDMTDEPNKYVVRVHELISEEVEKDPKGRPVMKHRNGEHLLTFQFESELRGSKLRYAVEQQAKTLMKE